MIGFAFEELCQHPDVPSNADGLKRARTDLAGGVKRFTGRYRTRALSRDLEALAIRGAKTGRDDLDPYFFDEVPLTLTYRTVYP
jgi:hypothetical protein